jgi:hypothetical protein
MNGKNVVRFPGVTRLDIDPDQVLQEAIGKVQGVVVAGYDEDGEEYFASSYGSVAETLFLLERFKKYLLETHGEPR